jgi:hypothetical protein
LLGFGVLRQGFSPPKGCERPLPCPPNPEWPGLLYISRANEIIRGFTLPFLDAD